MTTLDAPPTPTAAPPEHRPQRGRIDVLGPRLPRGEEVLTPEALDLLAHLHDRFGPRRAELLADRARRRTSVTNGRDLRFRPETAAIRTDPSWRVAGTGPGLADRRVEITSPADRRSATAALGSGAQTWVADLEDGTSPTWGNVIDGQVVLADAVRGWLGAPEGATPPTIILRPRGWHLVEKHLCASDAGGRRTPASASLVDFGLYMAANARELVTRGSGPYFYLPKLETAAEARLWDDVFTETERVLGLASGTIRATVLIETISAAFEMEEILFELREHCAGLNAGRWDYLASIIKEFRGRGPSWVLPDRSALTVTTPFMRAYTELLVATCHRRGAHAIGGMSTAIPDDRDPEGTERALAGVAADKRREAGQGFDGTWVAHPGLVATARDAFDGELAGATDQLGRLREDVTVTATDLLDVRGSTGPVTDEGVRANVSVAVRYMEAWLRGIGAVPIDGQVEDASTAEVSRAQLGQWLAHGTTTTEGTRVTPGYVEQLLDEVVAAQPRTADDRFDEAARLVRAVTSGEDNPTFFTVPGYVGHLVEAAHS
ncbi:malate synthase A [Modestobacter marinus]|uniref:malate synthase A n=1 Tax=Modestobacter marinus TaxID=477641 RepID=UPI001C988EFB|nr:malate synthase A [Modestobacter marinus]